MGSSYVPHVWLISINFLPLHRGKAPRLLDPLQSQAPGDSGIGCLIII